MESLRYLYQYRFRLQLKKAAAMRAGLPSLAAHIGTMIDRVNHHISTQGGYHA